MNQKVKVFMLSFLAAGFAYASIMAAFQYADGISFDIKKYVSDFVFFGIVMGVFNLFTSNRRKKNN